MNFSAALPYLTPPAESVIVGPWEDENQGPVDDRVSHWDPSTDLKFACAATIDLDLVRSSVQLSDDATLALAATWTASKTRLSGPSDVIELGALDGVIRAPLAVSIPGPEAGGYLDLSVALILRAAGSTASPIAPRNAGSVLWLDETRVVVEGSGARFPIAAVDFGAVPRLRHGAQWTLDWDGGDPAGLVLSDLRLLVNSASPDLVTAVKSGSHDPRAQAVRSFIMLDVARSLVTRGLVNDAFLDDPDGFEEGTVGRLIRDLLDASWPAVPVGSLADRLENDPARIERDLQAYLGVFQ